MCVLLAMRRPLHRSMVPVCACASALPPGMPDYACVRQELRDHLRCLHAGSGASGICCAQAPAPLTAPRLRRLQRCSPQIIVRTNVVVARSSQPVPLSACRG